MRKKTEFENWVRQYHDQIYAVIFHIVGNKDDALDCTQDVFIKAYNKLSSFRGEASPYTWLRRIATNHALNFVTRNRQSRWGEFNDVIYEAEDETRQEEERTFDKNWLEELSPMERAVVNARVYGKMSFKQVAESLKTTEGSAKVLYHKAVKKLQQVVK